MPQDGILPSTDDLLRQRAGLTPDQIAGIHAAPSTPPVTYARGLAPPSGTLPANYLDNGYAAILGTQPGFGNLSVAPPPAPGSNDTVSSGTQPVYNPATGKFEQRARPPAAQQTGIPRVDQGSGTTTAPGVTPPTGAGAAGDNIGGPLLATPPLVDGVDWQDENLRLRQRIDALWQAMPIELKQGTAVESGYRTYKQQVDAYGRYQSGQGGLAAPPGHSLHEQGLAADWKFSNPAADKWMHDNAGRFGLAFPLGSADPNHMQLSERADQSAYDLPLLQKTVYRLESSSGTDVQTSPSGAVGPMQIKPDTFRRYAQPGEDINNPQDNQRVGNRILADLYKRYGDMDTALIGYKAGEGAIGKPISAETQAYLDKAHKLWHEQANPVGAPYSRSGDPDITALATAMRDRNASNREILQQMQKDFEGLKAGSPEQDAQAHKIMERQIQDLDAERQMIMHPPIEKPADIFANFGSLATVVGVLGGMLSRRGLVASLDAAGSAMEAINTNNHEQWKDSFETWKTQTNMMATLLSHENQIYRDVIDDKKMDWDEKLARINVAAGFYGHVMEQNAAEVGDIAKIIELSDTRAKLPFEIRKLTAEAEEKEADADIKRTLGPLGKSEKGGEIASEIAAEHQRREREAKEKGTPPPPPLEQMYADPEEQVNARDRMLQRESKARQGEDITDDEAGVIWGQLRQGIPASQAMAGLSRNSRQKVWQLGVDQELPTMLTQFQQSEGRTPTPAERQNLVSQIGNKLAQARGEYTGFLAFERSAGIREAVISTAVKEAQQLIPQARALAEQIDFGKYPSLNAIYAAYERGTGDPTIQKFIVATNGVLATYSRAVTPTGQATDMVRGIARENIGIVLGKQAYLAALDQMELEMNAAYSSPEQVRADREAGFMQSARTGQRWIPDQPFLGGTTQTGVGGGVAPKPTWAPEQQSHSGMRNGQKVPVYENPVGSGKWFYGDQTPYQEPP